MKRIVFFTLLLALVLSLSAAFAWDCPSCNTPNEFNFCFNCGTKRPLTCDGCGFELSEQFRFCPNCGTANPALAAPAPKPTATPKPTPSLRITSVTNNGDGTAIVKWEANNCKAPYSVYCLQKLSPSFTRDLTDDASIGQCEAALWNLFYGSNANLDLLIPGQSYWIIVKDANGVSHHQAYTPGEAPRFPDFPTKITLQPKTCYNNAYNEVNSFSARTIANSPNTQCGLYVRLDYSQLAREREYRGRVAIKAPNGVIVTDGMPYVYLPAGRSMSYISFYKLDAFFDLMEKHFGTVPTGTYEWSLYYDGYYVNTQTFRVTE